MNTAAKKLGVLRLTEETGFFLCDPGVDHQHLESRFAIKLPCGNYEIYSDDYMFAVVKAGSLKHASVDFMKPSDEETTALGKIVVVTATIALVPDDFFETASGAIFQTTGIGNGRFFIFELRGVRHAWCGYTILF